MTSYNTKQADWYGAHQACALDTSVGEVFYVSEGGDDANDGLTPVTPRLTITAALALTTAGQDDYVIVLDYNIDHGEASWPIVMNKSDVHLIGTMRTGIKAPSHFVVSGTDHTIQIAADRIEIAGLSLGAEAQHACIVHSGYRAQATIHHCDFSHTTTSQDGILLEEDQTWNWVVHHCRFGQDTVGITRDCIRHVVHQAVRLHVHDCVFYVRVGGIGINIGTNLGGIYERNTFKVPDDANGEAITLTGYNVVGCTINNNWTANAAEALANNPYRDAAATKNHWGLNYSGLTPTYPVLV